MKISKTVYGLHRFIFDFYLKLYSLSYALLKVLKKEKTLNDVAKFLKRSILFSKVTSLNKYIDLNNKTKIDIYLPGLGTKAYKRSMDKLLTTKSRMPCSSALISITSACRNNCDFCYQKLDKGSDTPLETLLESVNFLVNHGVTFFSIQGGDPFLKYDRLKKVVEAIGDKGEICINSTGDGITQENLAELKRMGVSMVMFSLHSYEPEEFNSFLNNKKAWRNLIQGIEACQKVGVGISFNMTVFKPDFYNGKFEKLLDKAKEFKASYIQLIKPKPSGDWINYELEEFTSKDYEYIKSIVKKYNHQKKFRQYPSIWAQIINEHKDIFGCIAGGTERVYLNSKGDLQPCEFLNISLGNINKEDISTIFNRLRDSFREPCSNWLCETCNTSIYNEMEKLKVKSLPLDKEVSLKLLRNWDKGEKTKFYREIM